jgi:Domain of unknown function (DUF4157)
MPRFESMGDSQLKKPRAQALSAPAHRPPTQDAVSVRSQQVFPQLESGEALPPLLPAQERAWAASLQRAHGNQATAEMLDGERKPPPQRGEPLPVPLGDRLGRALNADLSRVRVHTNEEAAASTAAVSAKAFTLGENIYFARDLYDPVSPRGQRLIAHEVMHTQQQPSGARVGSALSTPGDAVEREANAAADAFISGAAMPKLSAAPPEVLLRDPLEALHASYESSEAYWKQQLDQVAGLEEAWNEKIPVVGYVAAGVLQSPVILGADLSLVILNVLKIFTPPDAQTFILVESTMGAGEVSVVANSLGRMGNAFLARFLAKNPKLGPALLRRVKDVARTVKQRITGQLGARAAAPRELGSMGVDAYGKTEIGSRATINPFGKTGYGPASPVGVVGRSSANEVLPQLERAAINLEGDRAAQDLWGAAARDYRYWYYVEAYFRFFEVPDAAQAVVRTWLSNFGRGPFSFTTLKQEGVATELQGFIFRMWNLARDKI